MSGQYTIHYSGSLGVKRLEFTEAFVNDDWARNHVKGNLKHYWPVYYRAEIWCDDGRLVAQYRSDVKVEDVT